MPPSVKELEKRLRGRGTETAEKIKIRLENAVAEMDFGKGQGNFDAVITNHELDEALKETVNILQSWYPELDLYLGK